MDSINSMTTVSPYYYQTKMSSEKPTRYHCFHCNEDLIYRVFCRHKEDFFNPLTNQWQMELRNDEDDSNDSIFTDKIDSPQNNTLPNDYNNINDMSQRDQRSSSSSSEELVSASPKGMLKLKLK